MTSDNKTVLYVSYASPKVKIEDEYILMGTNAIISATGGSLGLFLGLSCFGAVWYIFEKVENALSYSLAFWKTKVRGSNEAIIC